jgi:hypothetical protein
MFDKTITVNGAQKLRDRLENWYIGAPEFIAKSMYENSGTSNLEQIYRTTRYH